MRASPSTLLVQVVLLLLAGCARSNQPVGPADPDRSAPIRVTLPVDGGPPPLPDGGPNLPLAGEIGAPCAGDDDCDGDAACIPAASGFPDGYCTKVCRSESDCVEGSTCTAIGSSFLGCLDRCDPDSPVRQCRAGYGCSEDGDVCLPGCWDSSDCPNGSECAYGRGQYDAGRCYEEGSVPGDPCTSSSECPSAGFCGSEGFIGWPGGACLISGCDPATPDAGCPEGSTCRPGFGGGVCIGACDDGEDCRDGYACSGGACYPDCTAETACTGGRQCNPASGLCEDPFDPRDFGRACSSDDVCQGGTCYREFETGYPGSYCVFEGCDPATSGSCPGTGVCVTNAEGDGVCHLACDVARGCARDGYTCSPSNPADASSPTACLPRCESASDCANDGFVCDPDTRLCVDG